MSKSHAFRDASTLAESSVENYLVWAALEWLGLIRAN